MINKLILTIFFLIFFTSLASSSEKINEFKISGNDRISDATINLFTGYKINDSINYNDLNEIIKRLYDTNFFDDLSIIFFKFEYCLTNFGEKSLKPSISSVTSI